MDRQGLDRLFARLVRAALGALGFGCLTACLLLGPSSLSDRWRSGTPGDAEEEAPGKSSRIIGSEILETTYGPDFQAAVDLVLANPVPPSQDDLRRLAGEQDLREVWYAAKVRWILEGGTDAVVMYRRAPLESPWHFEEFLRIARGARIDLGGEWPLDESARPGGPTSASRPGE